MKGLGEAASSAAAARAKRFGPFWLETRIAVGGTAEVYLARPADESRRWPERLIVKRLLPTFAHDSEGRTMFDREAKLHAAIRHENVVHVYAADADENGEPYLAMEYIEGVDGFKLVRRMRQENRPIPAGVSVYIIRSVLQALTAVHQARGPGGGPLGIVHRDISPSNIYIGRDARVKLGDFGIARSLTRLALRTDGGQSQSVKGKFGYLAPEQVAGEPADQRADLFSAANVLGEMLVGRPLFAGSGQLAVLLAIRDCRLDSLDALDACSPPGLSGVLRKALSRQPDQRYPSAAEFNDALAPFESNVDGAKAELAALVRWVESASSTASFNAVRATVAAMKAVRPTGPGARRLSPPGGSALTAPPLPAQARRVVAPPAPPSEPGQAVLGRHIRAPLHSAPPFLHVDPTLAHASQLAATKAPPARALEHRSDVPPSVPTLVDRSPTARPVEAPTGDRATAPPVAAAPDVPIHAPELDASSRHSAIPTTRRQGPMRNGTQQLSLLPSYVQFADGRRAGPWTFSQIVEVLATGALARGDLIDYMGRGWAAIETVPELARFLATTELQTGKIAGPGSPEFHDDLRLSTMMHALVKIFEGRETGTLYVQRQSAQGQDRK
jgi:serine/threonine protein kinase